MRIGLGTLAAIAFALPVTAIAADLPVKVRPVAVPEVVYNWTGFYAGLNGGYSWGRDPTDLAGVASVRTRTFRGFTLPTPTLLSDTTLATAFGSTSTANIDGGVFGGQIGYNWQIDRTWVVGLETDIQWTGQRGNNQFCLTAGCPLGTFVANADYRLQWFGTARARAGILVDPRVLLYATGGLAYGQVKADYSAGMVGLPLGSVSTTTTRAGWTVGAGVEAGFWDNWTVKAEYLYVDLGSVSTGALGGSSTVILTDTPTTAITTVIDTSVAATSSVRMRDNIFRVGINYRFAPAPLVARY